MKKIMFVAALLFAVSTSADNTAVMIDKIDKLAQRMSKQKDAACDSIQKVATATMFARQAGKPMSEVFKLANNDRFIQGVIIAAYAKPHYSTDEMKQKVITDFADQYFLDCRQDKIEIDYSVK